MVLELTRSTPFSTFNTTWSFQMLLWYFSSWILWSITALLEFRSSLSYLCEARRFNQHRLRKKRNCGKDVNYNFIFKRVTYSHWCNLVYLLLFLFVEYERKKKQILNRLQLLSRPTVFVNQCSVQFTCLLLLLLLFLLYFFKYFFFSEFVFSFKFSLKKQQQRQQQTN